MSRVNYSIKGDEFIIEDYNNAKAFASFLPAIAGLWGKPLWLYYVNRGQAVSNFGIRDKDGAMLEFIAANKAWRYTSAQGFRTFYKIGNMLYEPFRNAPDPEKRKISQTMIINAGSIRLAEVNEEEGIETQAVFCTLPNENFPALLRKLSIKNISAREKKIECIDGTSILIPWGTRDWMLKNLSRLAEGWFAGVNFTPGGVPYYKLPVEPLDRPEIVPLNGAHFYCGLLRTGGKDLCAPEYCIDPDTVYGRQTDFAFPAAFLEQEKFSVNKKLSGKNKTPCAMGYFSATLAPDEETSYYSMIGHCGDHGNIDAAASLICAENFFEGKKRENDEILASISSCARTVSANRRFDNYCGQNFIDNALRGGLPVDLAKVLPAHDTGENKTYYAYSRVHGDMEREYNSFVVLSEYFSQGNGNYRDVNQNRRSDIFFNRKIGDENIHYFANLIQIDGFNPLKVYGVRFAFETQEKRKQFLDDAARLAENLKDCPGFRDKLTSFTGSPITIGDLFKLFEDSKISVSDRNALLASLLKHSKKKSQAEHGEGYWSDHWHYNTDLIENYLAVFPDRFEQLLLERADYTFYDDCYFVEPRSIKYVLFRGEPRQIRAVRFDPEKAALISSRADDPNVMRSDYGRGSVYRTSLLGKLLCVIANKYASLDPQALGIEMESDKPNWCDALNGLPGMFGSSSAESLELLRLVSFLIKGLSMLKPDININMPQETFDFLDELVRITKKTPDDFEFWDSTHKAKEIFREKTRLGISGEEKTYSLASVIEILRIFEDKLLGSRKKLEDIFIGGIIPTCFAFIPDSYKIDEDAEKKLSASAKARSKSMAHGADSGTAAVQALAQEKSPPIIVHSFRRIDLPLFLEGPVHYLRLCPQQGEARAFHKSLLASPLYDKKLDMIKINAPIACAGRGIGRITVFTPGWLENESIWLHMEYKYLLELLRNDLTDEFYGIAKKTLIPFLDPKTYGRSIYENSSFIASSAHPDESIHGQGFVARLSGATAEFISIWIAITSGLKPFTACGGQLCLELKPRLQADLFTEENTFTFNFLGDCEVVYHNDMRKDTYGKNGAAVQSYRLAFAGGAVEEIAGKAICGKAAHAVRDGKVHRIDVILRP